MQQNWLPGSTPGVGVIVTIAHHVMIIMVCGVAAAAAVVGSTQVIQMVILWKISLICQGLIPVH